MLKVFIADDSDFVRERLVSLLSELEEIELIGQAQDVPGALELLQTLSPDVAILDLRMPGGTGIQVLRTLKAKGHSPVTIMLTAFPYPAYREYCLEAGADFFFDKSTDFERILELLRRLQVSRVKVGGANGINAQ